MTETTDVLERLSFSVRTADGVTILDFHAGGCCPATSSEIECLREITRLRADNERLRGALEKIASVEGEDDPSIMWPWARESARAALKEPSNG